MALTTEGASGLGAQIGRRFSKKAAAAAAYLASDEANFVTVQVL